MGMYDTLNGEQVKCFSWVSFEHGAFSGLTGETFSSHGGSCDYFGNGDEVPWKSWTSNYTKNFLIVDLDNSESMDVSRPVIVHRIVDGKLEGTYYPKEDDVSEDLFRPGFNVIGYWGDRLNIHSITDLYEYYRDTQKHRQTMDDLWDSFPDYERRLRELTGNRPADKSSAEFARFQAEAETLMKQMDEVRKRRQAILAPATEAFRKKWNIPDAHAWEHKFGCFLEASKHPMFRDNEGLCRAFQNAFQKFVSDAPETILDQFFAWNGTGKEEQEQITVWMDRILGTSVAWQYEEEEPKNR